MPIFPRYPDAEIVLWQPYDSLGRATYYRNVMDWNRPPVAAVLHIAQGWTNTAREWARTGHYGASWTFWVAKDGTVLQQLDMEHGGYQAGITSDQAARYPPTWDRWQGPNVNVNHITVGIEHEGFAEDRGFTALQSMASIRLCRWLAEQFGWEWGDRSRFPAHADIDRINRVNDFGYPDVREAHYARMFASAPPQEEDMTEEETRAIVREELAAALAPIENRLARLNGAIVERMQMHRAADDPDYTNFKAIYDHLVEEGIFS